MTAITAPHVRAHGVAQHPFTRIWRVVRLHYTNRMNALAIPWMIAGIIFLANWVIWALIAHATGSPLHANDYSGSLVYILPYQVVFAVQSMNLTFPFALGLSSTRRDYYLGTALMYLIQAFAFSIGFTVLSYIEDWTDGWGVGGHLFSTILYGSGSLPERFLVFLVPLLFVLFVGSVAGAVFVRFRANGLYVLGLGFALVVLGAVALITFSDGWGAVGRWFVAVGSTGFVAWLLVPTAVAAVAGFFTLRRATPKS